MKRTIKLWGLADHNGNLRRTFAGPALSEKREYAEPGFIYTLPVPVTLSYDDGKPAPKAKRKPAGAKRGTPVDAR